MSSKINPFEAEQEKASVFELGYFAGFQDPAGDNDAVLPFSETLLDVYIQGVEEGREDAHAPPQADPSMQWVTRSELADESADEMKEHLATFTIFKALEVVSAKALFGLLDLVITVVGIQGNVSPEQFRPDDDDFEASPEDPPSENVLYVPACSRTDHAMAAAAVTPDGTWIGSASQTFEGALQAVLSHEHREAYIARCDVGAKKCSVVWLAKNAE